MGWLLASAVILAVSMVAFNAFLTTPAKQTARLFTILGVLVAAIILIVVSTRFGSFVASALGGLLIFLFREQMLSLLRSFSPSATHSAGGQASGRGTQSSRVETAFVTMTLDHASGDMDGAVRVGAFAGQNLSEMPIADLAAFCGELILAEDQESFVLVQTYVERQRPSELETFRQAISELTEETSKSGGEESTQMSREEAFAVLGLPSTADEAAIRRAHKTLMMKFHPDQDGSDYLARKINLARDVLLGH